MSRPIRDYRSASRESYKDFCEKNPKIKITFKQYKDIIYLYNSKLAEYLLETGEPVKMPYGLGVLVINKYKPKSTKKTLTGKVLPTYAINWQETKKHGKYIYYLNHHTEGYKYHFLWKWNTSRIKCAFIWKVEMSRVHSRALNSKLKEINSFYKDIYQEHSRI